jgi:predicted DNA binding CopG/RHH family protein
MKKKLPRLTSDRAAEEFVANADLTEYDLSQFKLVRFEFEKKTAQLNMRVPKALLDAVKKRAKARGIPYTRFVREAMELTLARPENRQRK